MIQSALCMAHEDRVWMGLLKCHHITFMKADDSLPLSSAATSNLETNLRLCRCSFSACSGSSAWFHSPIWNLGLGPRA